ncbi:circadian clock KaiB family protein [Kamptonema animale CS-326]|jgi:circadian clock protein KaiB|uniref:circadian clock KaiB family protein n=1 Tax=Kamptonema animale TaxID=92934 RepID=UPI00232E6566|nr:circadian clock KaiB family protein [Kamptonema animale]MDB9512273.1 circadian clock KaiB family protein [Kamptonema animale CS-326]
MVNEVPPEDNQLVEEDNNNLMANFEQAIAELEQQHYCLRLYIAGTTPRSTRALQRIKSICETYLQGRYDLEVIDVYQSSEQMHLDNIVAIPTLIKQLPLPLQRMIGDLSDTEKVLFGLDIVPK